GLERFARAFASRRCRRVLNGSRFLADPGPCIGEKLVLRHHGVGWCRHALKDASGKGELRLMARTEESTEPIRSQIRWRHLWPESRRAVEMRTDTYCDKELRLDRAIFVSAVLRLVIDFGLRIGKTAVHLRQCRQHFGGPPDDPDHLPAPFYGDLLAGLDLADVAFDLSTSALPSFDLPLIPRSLTCS